MVSDEEIIAKVAAKAQKRGKRSEKHGHILRMVEVPPADPDKPKPGEDKPSGARMYLRAFRPKIVTKATDAGGTSSGGADSAAIYEVHLPDHGDTRHYGTTPKKAFRKAMNYMATYSKMLADMMPDGEGAKLRDQGKPKGKKDGEGLQVVNFEKTGLDLDFEFKS